VFRLHGGGVLHEKCEGERADGGALRGITILTPRVEDAKAQSQKDLPALALRIEKCPFTPNFPRFCLKNIPKRIH
jgi:hypothetical protein